MRKFLKKLYRNKKVDPSLYQRITIGDDTARDFVSFEKVNKETLRLNGVNTNKIRFVFTPTFLYDIDNNVVNPKYTAYLPTRGKGTVIEVDKPKNVVPVTVNNYKVEDNYEFLSELVKQTKKGIVIYIIEHEDAIDINGEKFSYEFTVDSEVLRLRDLDEIQIDTEETEIIL